MLIKEKWLPDPQIMIHNIEVWLLLLVFIYFQNGFRFVSLKVLQESLFYPGFDGSVRLHHLFVWEEPCSQATHVCVDMDFFSLKFLTLKILLSYIGVLVGPTKIRPYLVLKK